VTLDDYQGAYQATEHLIEQGCTNIAHLTVDRSIQIYKYRFKGYQQALTDNGFTYSEDNVVELKSDFEEGKEAAKKLMSLDNPPDAIFSSTDLGALGAIKYLKTIGIRIPEEFCVVGFSNEPFTQFMELSMSTVDQSPVLMGKTAAKVFLEQIASDKVKIEKTMVIEPTLLIRKSSLKKNSI